MFPVRTLLVPVILLVLTVPAPAREPAIPELLPRPDVARPIGNVAPLAEHPASALWQAIHAQALGDHAEAIAVWQQADLPKAAHVWRELALGVALLELQQLDRAADHLAVARQLDCDNAVVYYYQALVYLEFGQQAANYPDALRTTPVRLVQDLAGLDRPQVRYQRDAIEAFRLAIEHAPQLDFQAQLLPEYPVVQIPFPVRPEPTAPRVADLLAAFEATDFVADAHAQLARLYLQHEQPERAEQELEQAAQYGAAVRNGYRRLGALYEQHDRPADAARAFLKSIRQGDGLTVPLIRSTENLNDALWQR